MTRQVTTVEELDALPIGTVIRDADFYFADGTFGWHGTVMPREEEGWLYDNCCGRHQPSNDIALPVTVLYEPGEQPRPLPDREQIARAMEQVLIESVGECTCGEAHTSRNLYDPDCLWHNVNPRGGFPGDAADAVLALLKREQGEN